MEKINIAELLKDCPKDMELDCLIYEDVYFDYVDELNIIHCYIQHETCKASLTFNQYGIYNSGIKAKCVIFPKGKTTWEGFQKPFEDGDIIYCCDEYSDAKFTYVAILKQQIEKGEKIKSHCFYNFEDDYFSTHDFLYDGYNTRFATEEEKQKLFQAIKDNGYKWNEETKTLEKLPKFKVGDCVVHHKYGKGDITEIIWIDNEIVYVTHFENSTIYCKTNDLCKYELAHNKFDINTLKPFDKVLVRCGNDGLWDPQFFAKYRSHSNFPFTCTYNSWSQCVPYEGNEHLLGTTNDCDEFYKNW